MPGLSFLFKKGFHTAKLSVSRRFFLAHIFDVLIISFYSLECGKSVDGRAKGRARRKETR